jgi:hypothetical protein
MRNPLTSWRRKQQEQQEQNERALRQQRERRILAALKALGPLSESDLAGFLGVYWTSTPLRAFLLDLAIKGRVVAAKQEDGFIWSIPEGVAVPATTNDA